MNRSAPLLLALVLSVGGTAARYPAQPPPQAQRAQRLENQGTVVNFYKHVRLTDPVNTLMIRARNVNGQVTEESHQVRLDAQRPQVWAAIIGIGDYQHPLVPKLNYTVADADAMYRYVVDDLGVPVSNVFKLIDAQATTSEIKPC